MADCSKTVEFLRELTRMCGSFELCLLGCQLCTSDGSRCGFSPYGSHDNTIAIVQKWSDEHPAMTWAGKLKELFADADICALTAHACPGWIFGNGPNRYKADLNCREEFSQKCVICWNGEYKEAEK